MILSGRARSAFARATARLSHAEITNLAIELEWAGPSNGTRADRGAALVGGIFTELGPEEASRRLIEVAPGLLSALTDYQGVLHDLGERLAQALQLEGLAWDGAKLIPDTPAPAALAPELSLLEQQLKNAGFDEALAHYRQAADNLASGNYEAANAQTRSFLESYFKTLCKKRVGKHADDAKAALQQLRNGGWLEESEWNHLRYLWGNVQSNGPHAGLTTADEALFRLHLSTAVGRYLLQRALGPA